MHERLGCLTTEQDHIALSAATSVDVRDVLAAARDLARCGPGDGRDSRVQDRLVRAEELLPGWYDDWVLLERERFARLRARSLEALAVALTDRGRFGEAIDVGLMAWCAVSRSTSQPIGPCSRHTWPRATSQRHAAIWRGQPAG